MKLPWKKPKKIDIKIYEPVEWYINGNHVFSGYIMEVEYSTSGVLDIRIVDKKRVS